MLYNSYVLYIYSGCWRMAVRKQNLYCIFSAASLSLTFFAPLVRISKSIAQRIIFLLVPAIDLVTNFNHTSKHKQNEMAAPVAATPIIIIEIFNSVCVTTTGPRSVWFVYFLLLFSFSLCRD